jgi:sulfhydrogenase subunit gamma (sulfur reductase)
MTGQGGGTMAAPERQDYIPTPCTIKDVRRLTSLEKLFRIGLPEGRELGHRPGQFVQVSVIGAGEAPISISSSPTRGPHLELAVRKAGKVTTALHGLKEGDTVGIRGPFGSFFDLERFKGKDVLLIPGGLGLAPMRSLIQYVIDTRDLYRDVTIAYGTKCPEEILFPEEIESWKQMDGLTVRQTVDTCSPSWAGPVGLITTLIPPLDIKAGTIVVIIGPPVMYKFVILELDKKNVPHENIAVSLERYMKCGVGKCGHCTIEHLYCCLDGPVFWLPEIEHLKGAL